LNLFKKNVAKNTLSLFDNEVDVLFFDVTTLYFESLTQDELRDFGFSKDCKFKEVQVVLALVTTKEGQPITYKLFPGNTYEGHTLIDIVKELKNEYKIQNILLVADRAMFNNDNLEAMEAEDLNVNYIVAAKLKSMGKKLKEEILSDEGYKANMVCNEFHWLNEFSYKNRRLIVSYSSSRARKDAADRRRLIDRLLKKQKDDKIKLKDLIPNYGTKKYLEVIGGEAKVNEAKISDDAKWDGLHGVITNMESKKAEEILARYRGLWQIEEAFRINKHNLKMRPIFHWKPKRIKAHISICFIAYSILRYAEFKLKGTKTSVSIETMREELRHVQSTIVYHLPDKKRYVIPSPLSEIAKSIYRCFKVPRTVVPYQID
jgi:transposase